jgi:hypothetical protein
VTLTSSVDGVVGTVVASEADMVTLDVSLTEAVHQLSATIMDVAGNTSDASFPLLQVTIDTTTPGAPNTPDLVAGSDTGDSSTDNLTNDTTPSFLVNEPEAGTLRLYSSVAGEIASEVVDGSGTTTLTASALADGVHEITAILTDTAGHVSPTSSALTITIDTSVTAPAIPDLEAGSDSGSSGTDNNTSDTTPDITVNEPEEGTIRLYSSIAGEIASAVVDGTGTTTLTASALADGTHQITAVLTDEAGNASAASPALSLIVDTTPPAVEEVYAGDGTSTEDILYDTVEQQLRVRVVFGQSVDVNQAGGTPSLTLELTPLAPSAQRTASYVSGSGTSILVFEYEVQASEESAASGLDYAATNSLQLNGGTIADLAGNTANLTLPTPGGPGSILGEQTITIDTIP